jgi:membrane-associated phospholipid phosphatase
VLEDDVTPWRSPIVPKAEPVAAHDFTPRPAGAAWSGMPATRRHRTRRIFATTAIRLSAGRRFVVLDKRWYLDINRFARTTPWGHGFMAGYYERVLSGVGAGILVLAALLVAGWWSTRSHPEHTPAVIWCALGTVASYGLNQLAAKAFVQARPYDALKGVEVLVPRASSLAAPSGHAIVAGAVFCGLLLARCWRLALVAFVGGLLLLFSAVYAGAAYPSQVGVGAAVGLLAVLALWPLASRLLLPLVAAIGSSPLAVLVVSSGSLRRPPRRPAKQLASPRYTRRMPDAKAMDALRAASEAARNATIEQGAGKGS